MSVLDLERTITKLPRQELDVFARWFEEFMADEWDRRIEGDIETGRLNKVGAKALQDLEAGKCTSLSLSHSSS